MSSQEHIEAAQYASGQLTHPWFYELDGHLEKEPIKCLIRSYDHDGAIYGAAC
jgi:hypothetical protein